MIIDDEPIAISGISEYIRKIDFLEIGHTFTSPLFPDVQKFIDKIDLLFLDIQMPELTGTEFLRKLSKSPITIFTTAHPSYALEGYELDVIDYLIKPIPFQRFLKAVNKAKEFHILKQNSTGRQIDYFFVKVNNQQEKIVYDDILYIEAMQHFVAIHTIRKKLVTYMTMGSMEKLLPADRFIKVHKSYIVGLHNIRGFNSDKVQFDNGSVPISRNFKKEVANKLLRDMR